MVSRYLLLVIFALALPSLTLAQEDHIKLLAVVHDVEGMPGSVADLHLEVVPGSGKVFLSTKPLTKVDMQLSVQFAKEYACDYLDIDCSNRDFFYTTRAIAPIVGGPSAGCAATVLTIAVLSGVPVNQSVSVTGTINSGGSIGIVGGIPEKLHAASKQGIEKVIIPSWQPNMPEEQKEINVSVFQRNASLNISTRNVTIIDPDDPEFVAKQNSIELVKASHIEQVLEEFNIPLAEKIEGNISVPEDYTEIMKSISTQLCDRAGELSQMVESLSENTTALVLWNQSQFYMQQAKAALEDADYYPAASFCFGASIRARYVRYIQENITAEELENRINLARKGIDKFKAELPSNISTISDLQALMIVRERIRDAEFQHKNAIEALEANQTFDAAYNLAYVIERLNSAKQWAKFLGREGLDYNLDDQSLRDACLKMIDEAQMRKQYINIFFPINVQGIDKEIDEAYSLYKNGEYDQCIFMAAKTKAEAEALISSAAIGGERNLQDLVEEKLELAEQIILSEQNADVFPLLGYSYYDYSRSLLETDPQSALIYAEYSLELSNLRIYFPQSRNRSASFIEVNFWYLYSFILGILFGMLVVLMVIKRKRQKSK